MKPVLASAALLESVDIASKTRTIADAKELRDQEQPVRSKPRSVRKIIRPGTQQMAQRPDGYSKRFSQNKVLLPRAESALLADSAVANLEKPDLSQNIHTSTGVGSTPDLPTSTVYQSIMKQASFDQVVRTASSLAFRPKTSNLLATKGHSTTSKQPAHRVSLKTMLADGPKSSLSTLNTRTGSGANTGKQGRRSTIITKNMGILYRQRQDRQEPSMQQALASVQSPSNRRP